MTAVQAKTLAEAYENLKNRPEYVSLIDDLTATGKVYKDEVEQFVYDLSAQLAKEEDLTKDNFESKFKSAVLYLILEDKYSDLTEAVQAAFPDEIKYFLEKGKLPARFEAVKDALMEEMFGSDGGGSGPGGGGPGDGNVANPPLESPDPEKKDETGSAIVSFKDVPANHWARQDIEFMAARSIVKGSDDNLFKPEEQVTRAEFTAFMQRALKLPEPGKNTPVFLDVPSSAWFCNSVAAAAYAGLVKGTGDGYFEPRRSITREEMATVIMRVYLLEQDNLPVGDLTFADASQISPWAKEAVAAAVKLGIIKGMDERHFVPREKATRAQAVVMIKRLLEAAGRL